MAAIVFTAILALLALFQLALAAGAPLGAYAWGGQHTGRLPRKYRIGSAVSVALYAVFALIALSRAGTADIVPPWFSGPATWVLFAYLVLGVLMNAASRSRKERLVMTPVAAILAALVLIVALG